MATPKKSLKGYYLTTFLIGLGFFTVGLMDPLYDTFVPVFLLRYIKSHALVGSIMTLDNILAVFLIPVFSSMSDRTRTPIGRRMPFIITCLPVTALAFGLIPYAALFHLYALILLLCVLNLFKQAARGPIIALMPDMVPGDLRSEANGVINTMGGVAAIVGTIGLARLMDIPISVPGFSEPQKDVLAFPIATLFVLVATILLFLFVKEKNGKGGEEENTQSEPLLRSIWVILHEKNKSALFILLSLFLWFLAYQGILPFIGAYSVRELGTSGGSASIAAGMVGIAYAIFAIPSGRLAHKKGRGNTIRVSLLLLVATLVLVYFHEPVSRSWTMKARLFSFWALMFLFGVFWVAVVTNSFPMLWQMSSYETVGVYTGLYYFFNQLASILAPPVTGGLIDLFGYRSIFLFGAVMMATAFLLMRHVDKGEPEDFRA